MNDELMNRDDWDTAEQMLLNSIVQPPNPSEDPDTIDKFHKLMSLIDKNSDVIPDGDYLEMSNLIKDLWDKIRPPNHSLEQNEPMRFHIPSFFPSVAEVTRVLENPDDTQDGETWMRVMMRDGTDYPLQNMEEVISTLRRQENNTVQLERQFPGFTVTHEFREMGTGSSNTQPN